MEVKVKKQIRILMLFLTACVRGENLGDSFS